MAHDLTFGTGNSTVLAAGNVPRSFRAIVAHELNAHRLAGSLAWAGFALLMDPHTITDCGEPQDQRPFHGAIIQSLTATAVETIHRGAITVWPTSRAVPPREHGARRQAGRVHTLQL